MSNAESTRTQPLLRDSKGDLLRARTFSATSIHTPKPENPAKTLCGHRVSLTSEYALTERDEEDGYGKAGELRQADLTICAGADPQLCERCERSVAKRQRSAAVEAVPTPEIPAESKTPGKPVMTENCGCKNGPHITCRWLQAAFEGRPATDPCNDCGVSHEAHDAHLDSRRFVVRLANGPVYSACTRAEAERVSADWEGSEVIDQEPPTKTKTVKSSEIQVGDIVRAHGMRVRIDACETFTGDHSGDTVYRRQGTVINLVDVLAAKIVPASFLTTYRFAEGEGWVIDRRDAWTVQGNDLARWVVEVQPEPEIPAEVIDRARTVTHRNGITQVFRTAQHESAIGAYQRYDADSYRTYAPDGSSLGTWATEIEAYNAVTGKPEIEAEPEAG